MDMVQIVDAIVKQPAGVRIRQGKVISYDSTTKRAVVTVGGSTVQLTGIRHMASYTPVVGNSVLLMVNGSDMWILGRLA